MKRAVALGFFDGVHIGHGALLKNTVRLAKENSLSPCVMTYSNHPSEVLCPQSVGLINSVCERKNLIEELYGINDIVIKEFTPEYSSLSCEEFFEKILIRELEAEYVIAGYDFRFGRHGAGDAEKLSEMCREHGMGCEITEKVSLGGDAVSSTRIRKLIEDGDMGAAALLLGHYHCTVSPVLHGQALGRKLGFPTANQAFEKNVIIPKRGVYVSRLTVDGETYPAITNIGARPTISDGGEIFAETHIPDFSGDIYGKCVKTEFVRFLREERRFSGKDELLQQISQDVLAARCEN